MQTLILISTPKKFFFFAKFAIYEFVNAVDFDKMTFLIWKRLQHITSNDKWATKRHIEDEFLNFTHDCCISSKKSQTGRWRKGERSLFKSSYLPAATLYALHHNISFISILVTISLHSLSNRMPLSAATNFVTTYPNIPLFWSHIRQWFNWSNIFQLQKIKENCNNFHMFNYNDGWTILLKCSSTSLTTAISKRAIKRTFKHYAKIKCNFM